MATAHAILWDFDGTLSYPNKSFSTALHRAISQSGYCVDVEVSASFLNSAYSWKNSGILYPDATKEQWWHTLFGKIAGFCTENGIATQDVPSICSRFRELLIDSGNYCLYDDTVQTLQQCAAMGYRNYIATNNYPEITGIFDVLGITPYLSGFVIFSHIGYEKPAPEFYDYAKQLCAPGQPLFMVGDNPRADIAGAQAAGLTAIAVHECKQSTAEHYCATLTELLPIINKQRSLSP